MPVCAEITRSSASFFKDFPTMYDDMETFIENVELVESDLEDYKQGFDLCFNLH